MKQELLTPPIKLTKRASAWPEHEVEAVNAAKLAGKSDAEIRDLVKILTAARRELLPSLLATIPQVAAA
ncbi:MAG TPA: hypothetical protein VFB37_07610 [Steroidobacteraceae bacterium]|nr:hypothetical protein [Steroidobacteraceae bacterium]